MKEFGSKVSLGDPQYLLQLKRFAEMGGFAPGLPMPNGGLGNIPFIAKALLSKAAFGPVSNYCVLESSHTNEY